jgi:formylglycine-generating enzyme required for sulfatase activity
MATLRDVLRRTVSNLQILQEKQAKQGLDADLKLLNEIEDHQAAIALLEEAITSTQTEQTLAELKERLRPLLLANNVEAIEVDDIKLEKPPQPFEPETVRIPAGPFWMGCDDSNPEESPRHQVDLPQFRIGRFPVTNIQYAAFLAKMSHQTVPRKTGWQLRTPPRDRLEHPVVGVSWHDAVAYCNWLSQVTGRTYRLPTEAEWEKAASWADGEQRVYPWGNQFDPDRCNFGKTGTDESTPVDACSPVGDSYYGCADMLGNVQEWTSTLWGSDLNTSDYPYPYQPGDGRENPDAHRQLFRTFYIHRGGSFRDDAERLRCTARGLSDPDSKIRWRGFRVALEQ